MYNNQYYYPMNHRNNHIQNQNYTNQNGDDRFFGLFAVPFLLGGLTGAALAPRRPYPVPYPAPYPVTVVPYNSYPTYSYNYYRAK